MKDGYYLSSYLVINKLAYLTNNYIRHDMNLALWQKKHEKIRLVHYWELERLTGLKTHDKAFFDLEHARSTINQLLEEYKLSIDDIQEIWGTPELCECKEYNNMDKYGELCYHSISHLFSALLLDTDIFFNEDMVAFAVDGGPDNLVDHDIDKKNFYAGCYSKKGKIIEVFPVYSPGGLWDYVSKYYGLREGTLMALASASKSEFFGYDIKDILINNVDTIANVEDALSNLFDYSNSIKKGDEGILFNYFDSNFSEQENRISMVMKEIQKASFIIMKKNIDDAIKKHKINTTNTYLGISGGYGLNCSSNSYLMKEYNFKGFIAPPCISDSGMSLGIGLYTFYSKIEGEKLQFNLNGAYYGNTDAKLDMAVEKYSHYIECISDMNIDKMVEDIIEYPIAWFNGAAEIGPRALGNRSLLADPRTMASKDALNKIKQRQWWRPVAPIILENELDNWFEDGYPSPYMLHTFNIKKEKQNFVPAIVHLDGSARVQTINEKQNGLIYEIINYFNGKYGVPILCNTSLNDKGEPIIDSLDELINFILRKNIRIAYVNGIRIKFRHHEDYLVTSPASRIIKFNSYLNEVEKEQWLESLNPQNIDNEMVKFYLRNPKLWSKYDIRKNDEIKQLKRALILHRNQTRSKGSTY